jgi:hypothetical protein
MDPNDKEIIVLGADALPSTNVRRPSGRRSAPHHPEDDVLDADFEEGRERTSGASDQVGGNGTIAMFVLIAVFLVGALSFIPLLWLINTMSSSNNTAPFFVKALIADGIFVMGLTGIVVIATGFMALQWTRLTGEKVPLWSIITCGTDNAWRNNNRRAVLFLVVAALTGAIGISYPGKGTILAAWEGVSIGPNPATIQTAEKGIDTFLFGNGKSWESWKTHNGIGPTKPEKYTGRSYGDILGKKPGGEPKKPYRTWFWFCLALLNWPCAIVYAIAATREETWEALKKAKDTWKAHRDEVRAEKRKADVEAKKAETEALRVATEAAAARVAREMLGKKDKQGNPIIPPNVEVKVEKPTPASSSPSAPASQGNNVTFWKFLKWDIIIEVLESFVKGWFEHRMHSGKTF